MQESVTSDLQGQRFNPELEILPVWSRMTSHVRMGFTLVFSSFLPPTKRWNSYAKLPVGVNERVCA